MSQDYARLLRPEIDKMTPGQLAQELFNLLNTAPLTRIPPSSDGFYVKFNDSGDSKSSNYAVALSARGDGWDYGQIVSGSGTTYSVKLNAGNTITATVPRVLITGNQTIPANAKCAVVKLSDNTYRLILAVWTVRTTS